MNRKEFIGYTARWFVLLTILLFAGFLARRRQITPGGGCPDNRLCRNCRYSDSCNLPKHSRYEGNEKEKAS